MQRCISHRPVSILLLSHQQPKILFFYSEYFLISTIFSNLNIAFTPAAPNIVSLDIFQFWIYQIHVGFLINMKFANTCPFFIEGFHLFVRSTFVVIKGPSRRKSLVAETTRNRYSFNMMDLNVMSYQSEVPFLATHFANAWCFLSGCSICLFPSWEHLLSFLHHWLDLLIKRLEVGTHFTWNCYWCRSVGDFGLGFIWRVVDFFAS